MPGKKKKDKEDTKRLAEDGQGCCWALFGLILGGVMVALGNSFAPQCKMAGIDKSSFNDPEQMGNLPKWFVYTGSIVIAASSMACSIMGCVPLCLRSTCKRCGGTLIYSLK